MEKKFSATHWRHADDYKCAPKMASQHEKACKYGRRYPLSRSIYLAMLIDGAFIQRKIWLSWIDKNITPEDFRAVAQVNGMEILV
ncbi:hypothetical protein [Azospirillum sp. sgz301742]